MLVEELLNLKANVLVRTLNTLLKHEAQIHVHTFTTIGQDIKCDLIRTDTVDGGNDKIRFFVETADEFGSSKFSFDVTEWELENSHLEKIENGRYLITVPNQDARTHPLTPKMKNTPKV